MFYWSNLALVQDLLSPSRCLVFEKLMVSPAPALVQPVAGCQQPGPGGATHIVR